MRMTSVSRLQSPPALQTPWPTAASLPTIHPDAQKQSQAQSSRQTSTRMPKMAARSMQDTFSSRHLPIALFHPHPLPNALDLAVWCSIRLTVAYPLQYSNDLSTFNAEHPTGFHRSSCGRIGTLIALAFAHKLDHRIGLVCYRHHATFSLLFSIRINRTSVRRPLLARQASQPKLNTP